MKDVVVDGRMAFGHDPRTHHAGGSQVTRASFTTTNRKNLTGVIDDGDVEVGVCPALRTAQEVAPCAVSTPYA